MLLMFMISLATLITALGYWLYKMTCIKRRFRKPERLEFRAFRDMATFSECGVMCKLVLPSRRYVDQSHRYYMNLIVVPAEMEFAIHGRSDIRMVDLYSGVLLAEPCYRLIYLN